MGNVVHKIHLFLEWCEHIVAFFKIHWPPILDDAHPYIPFIVLENPKVDVDAPLGDFQNEPSRDQLKPKEVVYWKPYSYNENELGLGPYVVVE